MVHRTASPASDAPGGEQIVTGASGTACEDIDTLPFGREIEYLNNCDPSYKFCGMERDDQKSANFDYAINPYNDNRLGRFLPTDEFTDGPVALFGVDQPS
jgi:hypothetical protein